MTLIESFKLFAENMSLVTYFLLVIACVIFVITFLKK